MYCKTAQFAANIYFHNRIFSLQFCANVIQK